MSANSHHITKLAWLNKQQEADADALAHTSPSPIARDMMLAHLRHRYGNAMVSLETASGVIVVKGLFTARPFESASPFAKVATVNPFSL